jgi:hypothetical protein
MLTPNVFLSEDSKLSQKDKRRKWKSQRIDAFLNPGRKTSRQNAAPHHLS